MPVTAHQIIEPIFERERRRLLRHRLWLFAIGWCTTAMIWGVALMLQSRLTIFPAAVLFTFQLGVLIAAIAICHAKASAAHVPLVVLAACVLLGLSSTGLFAAIGGYGDMLLFLLLTLYLASTPLFAWSGRAALVLLVGTLLPWLVALPFLNFLLHPADLAAAIMLGAVVSLAMLRWSRHRFQRALVETVASDAGRSVTDSAAHIMFAVDESGHFLWVNETLATLAHVRAPDLVARRYPTLFDADGEGGTDLDLEQVLLRPEGMRWWLGPPQGRLAFQMIAWASKDRNGGRRILYALGREIVAASDEAPAASDAPPAASDAAPAAEPMASPINEFAVVQEPLRLIGDEEVRRLRDEVGRLRKEVLVQNGSGSGRPRRSSEPPPSRSPASTDDADAKPSRRQARQSRVRSR